MKNKVFYEWDYETIDSDGDIVDHNHCDKLVNYTTFERTDTLVLIRDEGNDHNGLTDRAWAYVKDGRLPEYFFNADGRQTTYKVPLKYHAELASYLLKYLNK